jgi:Domain of unknown function (DUF1707)
MARRSPIRASDEDRELIADRLREATGEGRLLPAELEDRLTVALTARTHGQLDGLVSDLPPAESRGSSLPIWARASLGVAGAVGVLAAAATAAMLFSLIAGVTGAWVLFERAVLGRAKRDRPVRGALVPRAIAPRRQELPPARPPRRGRVSTYN